jgi:lipopolysaccharide biosynthesis glycosyltransferase
VILGVDLAPESVALIERTLPNDRTTIIEAGPFSHSLPPKLVPAMWARLGLAELLAPQLERVVYLDADTLTRRSLTPLFDEDLEGRVLGACVHSEPSHQARHDHAASTHPGLDYLSECPVAPVAAYFNSGVLAIDMRRWRSSEVGLRLVEFGRRLPDSYIYPDQDVLNTVLWDEWLPLDGARWYWPGLKLDRYAWETHVAHFLGPTKPWVSQPLGAPFNREYRQAAEAIGWVIDPGRYRVKAGLIETFLPYSLVLRRHRIGGAIRRRRD